MKSLDYILQRWRVRRAMRFVPRGARVLDVGCSNGALFEVAGGFRDYVGIDPAPAATPATGDPRMKIVRGHFPEALPPGSRFDAITLLATFEHVPPAQQGAFVRACFDVLEDRGVVVLTVPHPAVDRILDVLATLRLIDGIEAHQHYGYDVCQTPAVFSEAPFELVHHSRFQLGLNNLFVFKKRDDVSGTATARSS